MAPATADGQLADSVDNEKCRMGYSARDSSRTLGSTSPTVCHHHPSVPLPWAAGSRRTEGTGVGNAVATRGRVKSSSAGGFRSRKRAGLRRKNSVAPARRTGRGRPVTVTTLGREPVQVKILAGSTLQVDAHLRLDIVLRRDRDYHRGLSACQQPRYRAGVCDGRSPGRCAAHGVGTDRHRQTLQR